jgi:hypothetical protein
MRMRRTVMKSVAAIAACALLAVLLALAGCNNAGSITPGDGGGDGGGGGGGALSATASGKVMTSGGVAAAGIVCNLVASNAPSTAIDTVTSGTDGKFTFTDIGLNQQLKVRCEDVDGRLAGESGTFTPTDTKLTIDVGSISLSEVLPPLPPFGN